MRRTKTKGSWYQINLCQKRGKNPHIFYSHASTKKQIGSVILKRIFNNNLFTPVLKIVRGRSELIINANKNHNIFPYMVLYRTNSKSVLRENNS